MKHHDGLTVVDALLGLWLAVLLWIALAVALK